MSNKTKDKEKEIEKSSEQPGNNKEKMTDNKGKKQDEKSKSKKGKISETDKLKDRIAELEESIGQKDDQFLRLQAEFDNYRKRTLKEKMEMIKTAGESILVNVLPVMDDFERALSSMDEPDEGNPVVDGLKLIHKRFSDFLKQNGVSAIEAKEQDFDTDLHEAITKIPAPSEELKGKVVDVVQKGYMLNEKVIRYAKVVIGE
jgi:molecular chaperone GrpE